MDKMHRLLALAAAILPTAAGASPVLLVSIDGLRPGDVLEAEKRDLKIPTLRRLRDEGAYATEVLPATPSVTYPNHATMITGTTPGRHGIVSNTSFDPKGINQGGWYWYASDFKVQTLWDAAAKQGQGTLNVHWPVSVGANIRWNLPQIWRTGHDDDRKLLAALSTPTLLPDAEAALGPYAQGIDESIEGDETRTKFAAYLIRKHRPYFSTVYLTAYDNAQHRLGPDAPDAHVVLERIDAQLKELIAAARSVAPDTTIALVSDHGFAPLSTDVNLAKLFVDAGLIDLTADGKVGSWKAMPWLSGGSAYIRVADPADKARVGAVLAQLKARSDLHIADVNDAAAIKELGGDPESSFFILFEPGWQGTMDISKPLLSTAKYKGTHGYSTSLAQLQASFFIEGKGVKCRGSLGKLDMREIAPTLATIMGIPFRGDLGGRRLNGQAATGSRCPQASISTSTN